MGKVIRGTGDAKKRVSVIKTTGTGDIRQIRCQKCGELAIATPNARGGVDCRCPNCQTVWISTTI